MSHPFGDLLSQYLHRKHSLSQSRLAEGILQDPAVITKMCKGERLTGFQARERVLAIIDWLRQHDALVTLEEANALLAAAGMSGLREANLLGQLAKRPDSTLTNEVPVSAPAPGFGQSHDYLPVVSTPFIGRADELSRVDALLSDTRCRLLTLAGPGGVGKTRLAIEAASLRRKRYAQGVHFVNLQPVEDVEGVPAAIAEGLRIALSGSDAPALQLQRHLVNKHVLLVLDNFEHVMPAAELVAGLLAAAPGAQALVTSREVLNLREEWQFVVAGVSIPARGASADVTDLFRYDSVRLFTDCANRLAPFDSHLDPASVAKICQLTEGLPLAIEMAAAWTKTMSSADIVRELERGLGILSARHRNALPRHSSMQAVFDQSWPMLTVDEQAAFKRLSVFSGGFTRMSAKAIAGANNATLISLVDKSFLRVAATGRLQIHELLRQFGEEKLAESAVELEEILERHARFFAALLCDEARPQIPQFQLGSLVVCQAEIDNLRAMWRWAVRRCDLPVIRKTAVPLYFVYQFRCNYLEGVTALSEAARLLREMPETREVAEALFEVLFCLGGLQLRLGQLDQSEASLADAVLLERKYQIQLQPESACEPLSHLSIAAAVRGDYRRAESIARQALAQPRKRESMMCFAIAQYSLSSALLAQGGLDEAAKAIVKAIELCRRFGSQWFQSHCFITLGDIESARSDWTAAMTQYQLAYETKREFGDSEGMASALNKLGGVALANGDVETARHRYVRSLALYRDLNDRGGLATTLKGLGDASRIEGQYQRAAEHYRASLSIARDMGYISLIFALHVAAADLLFSTGHDDVAAQLAAVARDHPSSDHVSAKRAQALLEKLAPAASQLEADVDWVTAFEAACDAAARALAAGDSDLASETEWVSADAYLSD